MKRTPFFLLLLFPVLTLTSVSPYPFNVYSSNKPDFTLIKSTLTDVQPGSGEFQFNVTILNNGSAPATAGTVPVSWEEVMFRLPLSGGMGTLNESEVDLDLNGDDDKIDTFDVEWVHNETRPWDAEIDSNYVYALDEGPLEDPSLNRTYYIGGEPKLFQLGNKTHMLYEANEEYALFGLDAFILNYPSPSFQLILWFYDLNVTGSLNALDFKLNGEYVEVNHTITYLEAGLFEEPPFDGKCYIVPNQAREIDLGENVTYSCIIRADETIIADVWLRVNWSPDGNRRYLWDLMNNSHWGYAFGVNISSTTTTTSTSSTSSSTTSTPGFSILISLPFLLIIVLLLNKKRFY